MLLNEMMSQHNPAQALLNRIHFVITAEETNLIAQKLKKNGITPNLTSIKNYLIKCCILQMDEIPQPERNVIMRSGRPERV